MLHKPDLGAAPLLRGANLLSSCCSVSSRLEPKHRSRPSRSLSLHRHTTATGRPCFAMVTGSTRAVSIRKQNPFFAFPAEMTFIDVDPWQFWPIWPPRSPNATVDPVTHHERDFPAPCRPRSPAYTALGEVRLEHRRAEKPKDDGTSWNGLPRSRLTASRVSSCSPDAKCRSSRWSARTPISTASRS